MAEQKTEKITEERMEEVTGGVRPGLYAQTLPAAAAVPGAAVPDLAVKLPASADTPNIAEPLQGYSLHIHRAVEEAEQI